MPSRSCTGSQFRPILKAVAWLSGFQCFAAVTLMSFYGLGRIGEILPALRSDLLLPSDDCLSHLEGIEDDVSQAEQDTTHQDRRSQGCFLAGEAVLEGGPAGIGSFLRRPQPTVTGGTSYWQLSPSLPEASEERRRRTELHKRHGHHGDPVENAAQAPADARVLLAGGWSSFGIGFPQRDLLAKSSLGRQLLRVSVATCHCSLGCRARQRSHDVHSASASSPNSSAGLGWTEAVVSEQALASSRGLEPRSDWSPTRVCSFRRPAPQNPLPSGGASKIQ